MRVCVRGNVRWPMLRRAVLQRGTLAVYLLLRPLSPVYGTFEIRISYRAGLFHNKFKSVGVIWEIIGLARVHTKPTARPAREKRGVLCACDHFCVWDPYGRTARW